MDRAKETCKAQLRLQNTWNKSPRRGAREGEERRYEEGITKMSQIWFFKDINLHTQEAQQSPSGINLKRCKPVYVLTQLLKGNTQRVFKAAIKVTHRIHGLLSKSHASRAPWWSRGWESAFQCRGLCLSIPGQETKIPHASGQLSPHAITSKLNPPAHKKDYTVSKWNLCQERKVCSTCAT